MKVIEKEEEEKQNIHKKLRIKRALVNERKAYDKNTERIGKKNARS